MQRRPKKLFYPQFSTKEEHLRNVSDAAFKREPEDGYSLRGALFLRCEGNEARSKHTKSRVLDGFLGPRNTFAATRLLLNFWAHATASTREY